MSWIATQTCQSAGKRGQSQRHAITHAGSQMFPVFAGVKGAGGTLPPNGPVGQGNSSTCMAWSIWEVVPSRLGAHPRLLHASADHVVRFGPVID
mmetsp:Transcript_46698/g.63394  ORF Transcript_46698/g.63394 Transcript_46698/m.63394 type:complete len:94 (+) Transcript_46698:142-423(+)